MERTPWLRSPFTDVTAGIITHQWEGRCQDLELKFMECLEAYGLERGLRKCDELLYDFKECYNRDRQMKRADYMKYERHRQYWTGQRSKENLYEPPPRFDSF